MKPFSKFEAISGKPVVTRYGIPVTQLKEFEADGTYRIAGVIEGEIEKWTDDGWFLSSQSGHRYDLFMASEKREGWVAFGQYCDQEKHGLIGFCTHVFRTEEEAKDSFRVATSGAASGTAKVAWEVL